MRGTRVFAKPSRLTFAPDHEDSPVITARRKMRSQKRGEGIQKILNDADLVSGILEQLDQRTRPFCALIMIQGGLSPNRLLSRGRSRVFASPSRLISSPDQPDTPVVTARQRQIRKRPVDCVSKTLSDTNSLSYAATSSCECCLM